MMRDTGSPTAGRRERLPRAYAGTRRCRKLAARMRGDPKSSTETLSFNDVVDALGRRGEHDRGLQLIPLDQIVGSVDKVRDFDRRFRPTSDRSRQRWERLAEKSRMGEYLPPIDVYQLGNLYFVRDGHHRVSVARAQGATEIDAHVVQIDTVVDTEGIGGPRDLEGKNWGLRFLQRVPLTGERRAEINCTDPTNYHLLAEMVEAWACRLMHQEGAYFDKETMARRWFDEEYTPVVALIDEAGVRGRRRDRGRRLHPCRGRALPAHPRARLEPRRHGADRSHTVASVGRPALTSAEATSTSAPSGSGTGSPPTLASTRSTPPRRAHVEAEHVLGQVLDPGEPAETEVVRLPEPQQLAVELERGALLPDLPVDGQLAVHLGLRQPGLLPRSEAVRRGVALPRERHPAAVAAAVLVCPERSQVGSWRTSSGSWVASGRPSSSPW